MGLFSCRACQAKDEEIKHLLAQLDRLQELLDRQTKQLCELVQPGTAYRIEKAARGPRPVEPKADAAVRGQQPVYFPGYERDPRKAPVEIE